jgi:5-methylcytosine-specific restriction endonuclease McrA
MTNAEIVSELKQASTEERKITKRVIELIALCLERKLWQNSSYPSAHRWLVEEFRYSDSAAARRLDAARLLSIDADLGRKIESGEVTLTAAAKVQSVFYREEKRLQKKISENLKREVLAKIENQSATKTERILTETFPEIHQLPKETLKAKANESASLTVNFTKELLSHSHSSWSEIIFHLAEQFNKTHDPLQREARRSARAKLRDAQMKRNPSTSAAVADRLKQRSRDQVIVKAQSRCEYKDPISQKICGSKKLLQVDHIVPRVLGGTNTLTNLRCLCFFHNQQMAQQELGPAWANAWRKTGTTTESR